MKTVLAALVVTFAMLGGALAQESRLKIFRLLVQCGPDGMAAGDIEPLMTLLRRYATEAAREEARLFCDELVEMDNLVAANDTGRAAVAA